MTSSPKRSPTRSARRGPLALLCSIAVVFGGGGLGSCTYAEGHAGVFVTSTPPGARIVVDGIDIGRTTPSMLDFGSMINLDGFLAGDHELSIRKKGFSTETRQIYQQTRYYTSRWIDGAVGTDWPLPIFWTLGDIFTPFAVRWGYVPSELHVRLYPTGEGPGEAPARSAAIDPVKQ